MQAPSPNCPTCGVHVTGGKVDKPPPLRGRMDQAFKPARVDFDPCGHEMPKDWRWTSPTYPVGSART